MYSTLMLQVTTVGLSRTSSRPAKGSRMTKSPFSGVLKVNSFVTPELPSLLNGKTYTSKVTLMSSTSLLTTSVSELPRKKPIFVKLIVTLPPLLVGNETVAAASMQRDPIVAHCSELFRLGKMLSKDELKSGKVSFPSLKLFKGILEELSTDYQSKSYRTLSTLLSLEARSRLPICRQNLVSRNLTPSRSLLRFSIDLLPPSPSFLLSTRDYWALSTLVELL